MAGLASRACSPPPQRQGLSQAAATLAAPQRGDGAATPIESAHGSPSTGTWRTLLVGRWPGPVADAAERLQAAGVERVAFTAPLAADAADGTAGALLAELQAANATHM